MMARLRSWWRRNVIGPDMWGEQANLGDFDRYDGRKPGGLR